MRLISVFVLAIVPATVLLHAQFETATVLGSITDAAFPARQVQLAAKIIF